MNINDLRIHVDDSGDGELVVFVHGSWSDHHAWDAVIAELRGRRFVSYDRRGHGSSECPPGQGAVAQDVDDLAALVDALDAGPAHLVGNSLGAQIALRTAIEHPGLVRSLALHEPGFWGLAPEDDPVATIVAAVQPALERLAAGAWEDGARLFAEQIFGPGTWDTVVPAELKRTMVANAPTFLDEERDPDIASLDVDGLARVVAPTLLSDGAESHPAFAVVIERLAALLPHAERATLAGAGHVPHRTHPVDYTALLSSFWAAPAARRRDAASAMR